MMKRFAFLLLVVLVAMLSYAHADDAPALQPDNAPVPAPPTENDVKEQASPPGVTLLNSEPLPKAHEQFIGGGGGFIPTGGISYRYRFSFPYAGGIRYGWRYPIGWWNSFGRRFYGGGCGFGRSWGGFFYC